MTEFEKLLTKTARALEKLKIKYIVTGGIAVVYWGRPRFTADIDIVIELNEVHIEPLVGELRRSLGNTAYIDEKMIREEQRRKGEFNIIHPESGLKVDFFIIGKNPFDRERFARARLKKINKQTVRLISPEDLILSKLLWYKESGSSRHLEDAESVIVIQDDKLEKKYLRQWAERQSTINIIKELFSNDWNQ